MHHLLGFYYLSQKKSHIHQNTLLLPSAFTADKWLSLLDNFGKWSNKEEETFYKPLEQCPANTFERSKSKEKINAKLNKKIKFESQDQEDESDEEAEIFASESRKKNNFGTKKKFSQWRKEKSIIK